MSSHIDCIARVEIRTYECERCIEWAIGLRLGTEIHAQLLANEGFFDARDEALRLGAHRKLENIVLEDQEH